MHVLTFAIVSPNIADIAKHLEDALSGEDGGLRSFPTFSADCSCIGSVAHSAGFEAFDSSERGQVVRALLADARTIGDASTERELLRERRAFARTVDVAHPDHGKVDPACDTCDGRGTFEQSRDPSQHVDWWSVGGRWNRLFRKEEKVAAVSESPLEANTLPAGAVPPGVVPAAVITPDGLWFELPIRYSFVDPGDATPDELAVIDRWRDEVHELLETHRDCFVVLVDCHT
jgi:hypothetical protein